MLSFQICLLRGQRLKVFIARSEPFWLFPPSSFASCLLGHSSPTQKAGNPSWSPNRSQLQTLGL